MKKTISKVKKQYGIKIDPALDKYNDLLPPSKKLEHANKTLNAVSLPKLKKSK